MPITSVQADSKFIHIMRLFFPEYFERKPSFHARLRNIFQGTALQVPLARGSCSLLASRWTGASHLLSPSLPLSPTHGAPLPPPPSTVFFCVLATLKHAATDHDNVFISRFPRPVDREFPLPSSSSPLSYLGRRFFLCDNSACNSSGWQKGTKGRGGGEGDWYEHALKGRAKRPSNRCNPVFIIRLNG